MAQIPPHRNAKEPFGKENLTNRLFYCMFCVVRKWVVEGFHNRYIDSKKRLL